MSNRILILLILIGVLAAAAVFSIAQANSGKPSFVVPPAKQTVEAQQTQLQATAAAGPHATKQPNLGPMVEPASCPRPTPDGIGTFYSEANAVIDRNPFSGGENLMNMVMAKSSAGNYYWMWAGAPDDERGEPTPKSRQGLIRVIVFFADPCASHALGTQEPPMTDYLAPKGPLTFTKIEGDTILYNIVGGGSGRFNFVTGKFLP